MSAIILEVQYIEMEELKLDVNDTVDDSVDGKEERVKPDEVELLDSMEFIKTQLKKDEDLRNYVTEIITAYVKDGGYVDDQDVLSFKKMKSVFFVFKQYMVKGLDWNTALRGINSSDVWVTPFNKEVGAVIGGRCKNPFYVRDGSLHLSVSGVGLDIEKAVKENTMLIQYSGEVRECNLCISLKDFLNLKQYC